MRWPGYLAAGVTVGVLLAVLRVATVETAGIAAPVLLVTVVIIARFRGMGPALLAAALSAAGLSYYFLPPLLVISAEVLLHPFCLMSLT